MLYLTHIKSSIDFSQRPYFLNLVLIMVIGYFSLLMAPLLLQVIPNSLQNFLSMFLLLGLYILVGVFTYLLSRNIFRRISGESRSKILIISFFILLGFHLYIGNSHYIYSSLESDDDDFSKISDEIRQKIPDETRFEGLSDPEIFEILYTEHMCLEKGELCERYRELLDNSRP